MGFVLSLIKLYNQDELLKEISRGFAHRVASADLQDPEVRDSRTNPHVLEHRIKKQKVYGFSSSAVVLFNLGIRHAQIGTSSSINKS